MIVYEAIKKDFIEDVFMQRVDTKVKEALSKRAGIRVSKAEVSAFINSLQQMKNVLETHDIDDVCGVAIEYKIPATSKRVDFIITGYDEDGLPNVVVVELKQWSSLEVVASKDGLVRTLVGGGHREVTHPSYQAWSYSVLIKEYNESVRDNEINLYPCAYLHNYERVKDDDPLYAPQYQEYVKKAEPFVKGDILRLREFIQKHIRKGDNKEIIYDIDHGKIKPSKFLQDTIKNTILGHPEFIMIDTQKVIYENIKHYAKEAYNRMQKAVYIVEGGPGTGKSVVALQGLSYILSLDKTCMYVTKNAAPKNVLSKKLTEGKEFKKVYIDSIMKGSSSFVHSQSNEINCLIVDEAHRLIKRSQFAGGGVNQIKEIINSALFTVFFIDETQRVTSSDIGSIQEIKEWANHYGAIVHQDILDSQFRCNGSDGYIAWLDNTLDIKQTANETFSDDFEYDFKVFDDPNKLRETITELNKLNNKSRIVAGYCWEWPKEGRSDLSWLDIVIDEHDFEMSWNLDNTRTFAIDDYSIDQIGCIHTVQGLEFDYVGVIIGKDLRYEDGKIITDYSKRAKSDTSLNGLKGKLQKDPSDQTILKQVDEIIKNTYKTLMTRGQKGCYVYCEDKALANYLKKSSNSLEIKPN